MRSVVHFVGIGGAGCSALARVLRGHGMAVSGSDRRDNAATRTLRSLGVEIHTGDDAPTVPPSALLLVHSAAVAPDHPALLEARRRAIPVLRYAEMLGLLMESRLGIAVAGTHGKTTTTSMLAAALVHGGLDPTVVVGGDAPDAPGGARTGNGRLLLVEACEYRRSFHDLWPTLAVLTNIEADHLDYYRDLAEIEAAFAQFCARIPPHGRLIVCADDPVALRTARRSGAPLTTYGIAEHADVRASRLETRGGRPAFTIAIRPHGTRTHHEVARLTLAVPGRHNVLNALGAFAAARSLGLDTETITKALSAFEGVGRRLQTLYSDANVQLLDDYAHHPTEVAASIAALRDRFPGHRLRVVFQPHQYSRTRRMLDRFADALAGADEVIVAPIYAARDSAEDRAAVCADDLAAATARRGVPAHAGRSHGAIAQRIAASLARGDVVVTMGAGDVHRIAERLARWLRERRSTRSRPRTPRPHRTSPRERNAT